MTKKSTDVVKVSEPTINNNISMNLNQNDLLELVVQEKINQLEEELKEINAQLVTRKECQESENNHLRQLIISKKNAYKIFSTAMVKLGIQPDKFEITNIKPHFANTGKALTYSYNYCHNVQQCENSRNPVKSYEVNSYTQKMDVIKVDSAYFNINAKTQSGIVLTMSMNIEFTPKEQTALFNKTKVDIEKTTHLYNRKFEVQKEILIYTYGDKKIKAQFTKAYLNKSAQGKDILKFLEKAAKVNLSLPA